MFYFDANATTPLGAAGRAAWLAAQESHWQNSSSLAAGGVRAHVLLEACRARLQACVPAGMEIVFTGGATEANNAVMRYFSENGKRGATANAVNGGNCVAISALEHASVTEPASAFFANAPFCFGASHDGVADVASLEKFLAASASVAGVSLMAVNNETGVIQPVQAARRAAAQAGVPFHCDASQAFGKLPSAQLREMLAGCDFVSGCAHKFGGPKGVGFLAFSAARHPYFRMQMGGGHENQRRAGTPDVPAIAAMLAALEGAEADFADTALEAGRVEARVAFEREICAVFPGVRVNGASAARVWNTVSLTFPVHENLRWAKQLERRGFVVGIGSACANNAEGGRGASHVLLAMGLSAAEARRTIRISAWRDTPPEAWVELVKAILEVRAALDSGC